MMPGLAKEGEKMRRVLSLMRGVSAVAGLCGAFAATLVAQSGANLTDKLKNLEFREIGPAIMGGRIDDIAAVESNPNIVYVGAASGGVWKTTNNGRTFEAVCYQQCST